MFVSERRQYPLKVQIQYPENPKGKYPNPVKDHPQEQKFFTIPGILRGFVFYTRNRRPFLIQPPKIPVRGYYMTVDSISVFIPRFPY